MQSGFHAPTPAAIALEIANRHCALRRVSHGKTERVKTNCVDISSEQMEQCSAWEGGDASEGKAYIID